MMKWHYFWHWAKNNIDVVLVDGADEMEGVAGRMVGPKFGEFSYVFSGHLQD